jgi:hypothetical protein
MANLQKELDLCEDHVENLARQLKETRERLRNLRSKEKIKNTEITQLKGQIKRLSVDYSNFLNRFGLKLGHIMRKKSLKQSKKDLHYTPLSPGRAKELAAKFKKALILKRLKSDARKRREAGESSDDSSSDGNVDVFLASLAKTHPDLWQQKQMKKMTDRGGRRTRRRKRRTRRRKRRTRRRRGGAPRLQPNASLEEVINVVNECCGILPEENAYKKRKITFGKITPNNPFGITYGKGGSRRKRRTRRR